MLGIGLECFEKIPAVTIIGPYFGEVKQHGAETDSVNHYKSYLTGGMYVDTPKKGNLTQYINHWCQSNCNFIKRNNNG